MLRRLKDENGMVTVEATISLSSFMFAIVTILSVVNICIVQARMSYALNTTAREISQYSYLYSLTGLNDSHSQVAQAGEAGTQDITKILADVNTVYNEIENLGNTGNQSIDNIDDILSAWDSAVGSAENIEAAGGSIKATIEDIAKDPKNLLFGIAKMAASETFDLAKSRLIAEPLAKAMIKKHLVSTKDGDVDQYLKALGVAPSGTGSYFESLDFSNSLLFPEGSSIIMISVSYQVKIIPLLPIDLTFDFTQTATTHGWLSGSDSYRTISPGTSG